MSLAISRLKAALARMALLVREHRAFLVITITLTLVMTWPTAQYVFRTDVFWLPTRGSSDVLTMLWNIWYGGQWFSGQADLWHTNLMFYPNGISLVYHPINLPYIALLNILKLVLPTSNAFCATYLILVLAAALSAYIYLGFLFHERHLATFGAVVFALSPQVLAHSNQPDVAFVAPIPLALYFFHRGIVEKRKRLVFYAGAVTGLSSFTILYLTLCIIISLSFYVIAFGYRRFKERQYLIAMVLLIASFVVTCFPRVYPMIVEHQRIPEFTKWAETDDASNDILNYFVNWRGGDWSFFHSCS